MRYRCSQPIKISLTFLKGLIFFLWKNARGLSENNNVNHFLGKTGQKIFSNGKMAVLKSLN